MMSEDKEELVLPGENIKPKALGIRHLVVFMGEVDIVGASPRFPWVCQRLCHEGQPVGGNCGHGQQHYGSTQHHQHNQRVGF